MNTILGTAVVTIAILAAPLPMMAQLMPPAIDAQTTGVCCGGMQQLPIAVPCAAVTSMLTVTETQLRSETYLEQVPVTRLETVTVDEGRYQTVWVPKLVAKQIPRTVMTQQVKTRTVPVQVVRQVPQTVLSIAPTQAVQLPPQRIPYAPAAPAVTLGPPDFGTTPVPAKASPTAAEWRSVPQRKASSSSSVIEKKTPPPLDDPAPLQRKTSAIPRSIPTAATVWTARTQGAVRSNGAIVGLKD